MQEGIGRNRKNDAIAVALDADVMHELDGRLGLALRGAESREIVPAQERLHGLPHQVHVQRPEKETGAPFHQRRTRGVVIQHIMIGARAGAEAGVEEIVDGGIAGQFPGPAHGDRFGQEGVDAAHPRVHVAVQFRIEMHHLLERMHARVRAAGAGGGQAHAGKLLQRVFQLVLHRLPIFLFLVSMPGRAVVLQAEDDTLEWGCCRNILHRSIIPAQRRPRLPATPAPETAFRARRMVEDSTNSTARPCNAAMDVVSGAGKRTRRRSGPGA